METEEGQTLTDQPEIRQAQASYYRELYKEDNNTRTDNDSIADFLGPDINLPSLNDQDRHLCEENIKEAEAADSIKDMVYQLQDVMALQLNFINSSGMI